MGKVDCLDTLCGHTGLFHLMLRQHNLVGVSFLMMVLLFLVGMLMTTRNHTEGSEDKESKYCISECLIGFHKCSY